MPVTLTPLHLVRAGDGPDAVRLHVRGFGLVLGSLGVHLVFGTFDRLLLRRFKGDRCRVFFLGLPPSFRSVALGKKTPLNLPAISRFQPPSIDRPLRLPPLKVQLTVHPPEPP